MHLTILGCALVTLTALHGYNEALPVQEPASDALATTADISAPSNEQAAPVQGQLETIANKNNCLLLSERIEDCQDELTDSQLPAKVIVCLNNCAVCVKQWRSGVYNGRVCALDCIQQVDHLEALDPDCSVTKYFNATMLESAGA